MEHLTISKSIKPNLPKLTSEERIFLTTRDLEIISFVCDMKFASLEDLHFKFFKTLKNGNTSNSLWWARERLTALEKAEFVMRKFSFDEKVSYYLGTPKGYKALQERVPETIPSRPVDKINHTTFNHDKMVIEVRNKLEAMGKVKTWYSDRKLFMNADLNAFADRYNQPDGIYVNASGERIAVEIEISKKDLSHYREKIKTYVNICRETDNPQAFKKILYVTGSEPTHKTILAETKIYSQYFTVVTIEDFRKDYLESVQPQEVQAT